MEKIFRVMGCSDAQKVSFATFKRIDEAEHWGDNANRRMENLNTAVTWAVFTEGFLESIFLPRSKIKRRLNSLL